MNSFLLADNILKLRHQKNITQDELARFIGVTKASVSKWETKQSLPDILLLPQLATFFDVTVDELIGYEPQLSKEQIQKYYLQLTSEFACFSFEEVMAKVEKMVKQYYSCYPFLLQICVLLLNHFMLAISQERQIEILNQTIDLCTHIIENCQDSGICNDAIMLKAVIDLQCGRADEVIDVLEEMTNPYRLRHGESLLIQAYQMIGKHQDAHQFTQFSMYLYLMEFISLSIQYLCIHMNDFQICQETINKINQLIDIYYLDELNPNLMAQFHYQNAIICCGQNNVKDALKNLKKYAELVCQLLSGDNLTTYGNEYFDTIHIYFENSDLGVNPVRDKKVILKGAIEALTNPMFACLDENTEFQSLKQKLAEKGEFI